MEHHDDQALKMARLMRAGCLGVRVGRMHRLVTRVFEEALRPLGLSLPQLELLSALTIVGVPVRPAELADLTSVERSTMSRNLAVLQDRGWVVAAESSPTGRTMAVTITPEGSRQLADARAAWHSAQHAIIAATGADAPAILDTWITELARAGRSS